MNPKPNEYTKINFILRTKLKNKKKGAKANYKDHKCKIFKFMHVNGWLVTC